MVSIDKIIAYEQGDLGRDEQIDLFAELIKSGDAFRLQGSYGRQAVALIKAGYISQSGDVLNYPD